MDEEGASYWEFEILHAIASNVMVMGGQAVLTRCLEWRR
jgi:hypothetical protein